MFSRKIAIGLAAGLVALVSATLATWAEIGAEDALPGGPVVREELDALWAGGCGQVCTQA